MTEYVDIVDEEDNVIDTVTRKEAEDKTLRMRSSKILVFDEDENLIIQKRSNDKKRTYPGMWDIAVAETVQAGESYLDAASRGLKEEYGICCEDIKFLFKFLFTGTETKRNYEVFKVYNNDKINFDKKEVEKIRVVNKKQLLEMFDEEEFTPSSIPIYEEYLKNV